MCGFLGEVAFGGERISHSRFEYLLSLSKSRGPNETRIEGLGNRALFGFNRLSVLDLTSNASQPMWSPSKRYLLMFNGEIYNHMEIRKYLSDKNTFISSSSDTVTLAHAIDEWGIKKTIEQLDGMFAIAIYDRSNKSVSLIRDFAGIKPLFYGLKKKHLVFSSKYNQLSKHPIFQSGMVDTAVLKLYLTQHFIPPPFGILENTFSLSPGEIINFDYNGDRKSHNYWTYPSYEESQFAQNEVIRDIEFSLQESVKSQMISDVPIGAFLSGGVDSPLICFNAKKTAGNQLNTYSLTVDSPRHDESFLSTQYANTLNVHNELIEMNTNNAIEILNPSISSIGEPFGDFSILPTWKICKVASADITVALSGDGGDELFFGYERFNSISKNYWLWSKPYSIRYLLRGLDKLFLNEKYLNDCVLYANPGDAHFGLHNRFSSRLIKDLIPVLDETDIPEGFNIYKYEKPKTIGHLLHEVRKSEFYGMLQKTLIKVDRASMAHGLEVRVPFLKKSMIRNVLSYGVNVHEPLFQRKKLLFELLKRSYPKIKPELSKKGLTIPLKKWISKCFKDEFYNALLDDSFCYNYGINKQRVETTLESHYSEKEDLKWPLFSLYSLSIWDNEWR
ncbi:MAG: asparagine synthase (glutamine-hydrolyzing) [Candidatus Marinimicrobia bacterium]|nr:asparagine synthase (glutamine-hydrolyzing) [Candidatus Neomarinimicrobiota bacterium]